MKLLSTEYLDRQAYRRNPLLRLAGLAAFVTLVLQLGVITGYIWLGIGIRGEEQIAGDLESKAQEVATKKLPLKETAARRDFITSATPALRAKMPVVGLLARLEREMKAEIATEEIIYRVEEHTTDPNGISRAKVISVDVAGVAKKGTDVQAAFTNIFPDASLRTLPASTRRTLPNDSDPFRILARWQAPPVRANYDVREAAVK